MHPIGSIVVVMASLIMQNDDDKKSFDGFVGVGVVGGGATLPLSK